ncbi:hypothetical protein [Nakamurella sp.]|uniref:hypothetical protein n=1 Tax=Nakamurella sp. TaxID=1869182 RepID=UPI00378509D5
MRRHSSLALVAGVVLLAGCGGGTAGQPAVATSVAAAGPSSSPADPPSGSGSGDAGPKDGGGGVMVDASVVERSALRPMQVETDDFWEEILGIAQVPVTVSAPLEFLVGAETFDCGGVELSATDQYGPTYCAPEDTIVVSETFMTSMGESAALRTDGTFADQSAEVGLYFLLAHQWGHNILEEMIADRKADVTLVPSNQIEATADCFAGLAIAGVPRVFADKDPAAVLSLVPIYGERFSGIAPSPVTRQKAIALGLAKSYDDRAALAAGVGECLTEQAPALANALGVR